MSETVEVPVLSLGREQTQMWAQAFLATARLWRERRDNLGRLGWSDSVDSARRAEALAQIADPPVRTMTLAEAVVFQSSLRGDQNTGQEPHPEQQNRTKTVASGATRVTVAPMTGPGHDAAWGVLAEGRRTSGEQVEPVLVRCRSELVAKQLAGDVLRRGPGSVERLTDFARLAGERAAAAVQEVIEPEPQRLARTAATVREAWSEYGDLAGRVITATAADRARGHEWNPAFGELAWRLHQLEERGFAMADILDRVQVSRLLASDVRNPAAFAEWMVEEMTGYFPLVNLDGLDTGLVHVDLDDLDQVREPTFDDPGRWVSARRSPPPEAVDPGHARESAATVAEETIGPLLHQALPLEVLTRVQQSRRYPQVREELFAAHTAGGALRQMLADLPASRIAEAHDPASYLAAVVRGRERRRSTPHRRLVDKVGMAALVGQGCPRAVADGVVASPSWPGLVKRLAGWQRDGLPVIDMLAALPHPHLARAKDPAAYVITLMNAKAAGHRRDTAGPSDDGPGGTAPVAGPRGGRSPAIGGAGP